MRLIVRCVLGPSFEEQKACRAIGEIDDISHTQIRDVDAVQAERGLPSEAYAHERRHVIATPTPWSTGANVERECHQDGLFVTDYDTPLDPRIDIPVTDITPAAAPGR
jgi:hypothetical protein